MSKYLYTTVYEEFTGVTPPEPTDNKQRRKRGYGHPYRMRLNYMQDDLDTKAKRPERRNQFGRSIADRKHKHEVMPQSGGNGRAMATNTDDGSFTPLSVANERESPARLTSKTNPHIREERRACKSFRSSHTLSDHKSDVEAPQIWAMVQERQGADMPRVVYKKRRSITLDEPGEDV